MAISNIVINKENPEQKSILEWLICLKVAGMSPIVGEQSKKTQLGFITGYGIERVPIEIPALHLDDLVPNHIMKECK
jgi:hypothetical protein